MDSLTLQQFEDTLTYMSEKMGVKQAELAAIDAKTGDGDLGVTIVLIFRTLKKSVKKCQDGTSFSELFKLLAEDVGENAPSTFGTFFSTMLESISKTIGNTYIINGCIFAEMLKNAADGVMERGGANKGDKTLLDALIPASDAANGKNALNEAAIAAAEAATKGAEETERMQAVRGRAGYMGERTIGYRDGGAQAIAEILKVFADYCDKN